jgi:hypothetical protein
MKIEVLRLDGTRGFIPLDKLDKALLSGKFELANPEQKIEVINPQGEIGYIKGSRLVGALKADYQLNKNQIAQKLPKGDDWLPFVGKKAALTLAELTDTPANLANLGESGIRWLAGKMAADQKEDNFDKNWQWQKSLTNELEDFSKQPNYFREENVDRPSTWIKQGLDQAGIDITPRPKDDLQKIAGHGIEWALPGGILTKFNKAAKGAMIGGTLGLGSGFAQETLGADPLASNLTATGLQMVTPNPASLLNKFSKQGKITAQEAAVSKLLKDITKEQGLERLKNFKPQSLDVIPTTAEVALNRDISNLHNAYAPNLTGIDAKRAYNDAILRDKLNAIGNNFNPSAVEVGEAGRSKIQNTLKSAEAKRTAASADLYKNLEKSQNTYPVSNFENYTNNSIIAELGDIEKGLVKNQNILPDKYQKLTKKSKEELSKLEKELEKEIISIEKKYPNLSVQAKEQILSYFIPRYNEKAIKIKTLKTEIASLESGQYKPSHIDRAISEIGNNIIELKRSEKGGNKSLLRHFKKQKEEMLKDLNATPEGSAHRAVYSQHSKPVNAINQDKLLKKFVSKNEFDQYRIPVDDLPRNIMKAPNENIRNYMEHIKGHKAEDLTKSYVRDMYLGKAPDGSIPTYDKSNNFLRTRKEKINAIYSPEELNTFDEVNSYLKNRAEVSKGNSAYGSATAPKSELQAKVQKYLGSPTQQPLALLENIPGLPFKQWASKQFIRPNPNYGVLEEALIDPIFANSLLGRQPLPRKKGNYLPSLFTVLNNSN